MHSIDAVAFMLHIPHSGSSSSTEDYDFSDRTCDLSTIEDAVDALSLAVNNYYK